jgi:predicted small lipoprotein YifL
VDTPQIFLSLSSQPKFPMFKTLVRCGFAALLISSIMACGFKGPLYLPDAAKPGVKPAGAAQ